MGNLIILKYSIVVSFPINLLKNEEAFDCCSCTICGVHVPTIKHGYKQVCFFTLKKGKSYILHDCNI